jgi:hypothetical protein
MVTALRLTCLLEIFFIAGCATSGPTIKDYQVITQALQADARQAQRTITDLEMQRQGLQRDLGEARAAFARLEGKLLNAERRLLEARHIVDLQREELAHATDERQRLAHSAREMDAQLQEQRTVSSQLRQQMADAQSEQIRHQTMDEALVRQASAMAELKAAFREALRAPVLNSAEVTSLRFRPSAIVTRAAVYGDYPPAPSHMIRVRRGDSLWALARLYGVALDDLIAANQLKTDLIVPGQELRLPDPAP